MRHIKAGEWVAIRIDEPLERENCVGHCLSNSRTIDRASCNPFGTRSNADFITRQAATDGAHGVGAVRTAVKWEVVVVGVRVVEGPMGIASVQWVQATPSRCEGFVTSINAGVHVGNNNALPGISHCPNVWRANRDETLFRSTHGAVVDFIGHASSRFNEFDAVIWRDQADVIACGNGIKKRRRCFERDHACDPHGRHIRALISGHSVEPGKQILLAVLSRVLQGGDYDVVAVAARETIFEHLLGE